ncbi:LCP family protein [Parafrankia sp. FMc2]|uniref:LCP family protein n=1 Tax=Parafrankia sp. FMc2 TaxID=3233196 RepID=UPI0034D61C2B
MADARARRPRGSPTSTSSHSVTESDQYESAVYRDDDHDEDRAADGDEGGADDGDRWDGGGRARPGAAAEPARRGPLRRVLLVLTSLVSLGVVAVTATGWLIVTFYDHRIDRETIAPPTDITVTRPPPAPVGAETWLLVGSDVRTGSDAARVGGARSDTMMIAHLASDGATDVVSIPRDLRVPIPAWTDSSGVRHRARSDRVNAAFNSGGPALLVATLEQVAGLRINHYAELDFTGFRQMTSAIGGIDVCLRASPYVESHRLDDGRLVRSTNLDDPSAGFTGQAGDNHLIGDNALAFVRQRHGFADGDLSRIRRQQTFLAAIFRKLTSESVLLSPTRLTSFLSAVTDSAVLDDDTDFTELRALATRMRAMTTGAVTFSTVPITGQVSAPAFYFLYDPDEMRQFFRDITGNTVPFEPPDAPADPLLPPDRSELSGSLPPAAPTAPSGRTAGRPTAPPTVTSTTPPAPQIDPSATAPGDPQGGPTESGPSPDPLFPPQPTGPSRPETTQPADVNNPGGWPRPEPTASATTAPSGLSLRLASLSSATVTAPAAPTTGATDAAAVRPDGPSPTVPGATEPPVTAAASCIY